MSDHFMHAFSTGELCSGIVSIKLLPYYNCLENILVEGKARNKHRPVNKRESSYKVLLQSHLWYKNEIAKLYFKNRD